MRVSCWCAGPVRPCASLRVGLPPVDDVPFVVADFGDGVRTVRLLVESVEGVAGNLKSRGGGWGRREGARNGSTGPIGLVARELGRLARPKWDVSTLRLPLGCSLGVSVNGNGKACEGDLAEKRQSLAQGPLVNGLSIIYLFCTNPRSYCSFVVKPGDSPSAHDPWLAGVDCNGAVKVSDLLGLRYQWRGWRRIVCGCDLVAMLAV
jgi:hypothetical protein